MPNRDSSPPIIERSPRVISAGAGVWLMFMPALFGYEESSAAASDRIVGPFVAGLSVVAIWEVTRGVRWAALPLGAWMVIAPLLLDGYSSGGAIGGVAAGLVIIGCAFLGGKVHRRFGGGWPALFRPTAGSNPG